MTNLAFREYTRCTKEEKMSCLPLIDEMVSLAATARKEGLLVFAKYAATCESALLRAGLELAADGIDKFAIKEFLQDMIHMSDTTGVELLRQLISANGILGILNGDNPRIIRITLTAWLGEEVYGEVMKPEEKEPDFIDTINNTAKWMKAVKEFLTAADKVAEDYDIMSADDDVLAFLLLYLEPKLSLKVFETLDKERRIAIILAMVAMDYTKVNLTAEIMSYLHPWKNIEYDALSNITTEEISNYYDPRKKNEYGGFSLTELSNIRKIAGMLRAAPWQLRDDVLSDIADKDEALCGKIKEYIIVFEDFASFSDQTVQRILREVSNADLAVALKMSSDDARRAIFSNISQRLAEMLEDDMEVLGDMPASDIEAAQQKIVGIIRKLGDEGEIIIPRSTGS